METQSGFTEESGQNKDIHEEFEKNVLAWKAHVKKASNYSMPGALIACESFKNLTKMSDDIIPYIFREYETPSVIPWSDLLKRITGQDLGNWMKEDPDVIKERWFAWGEEKGYYSRK